MSAPFEGLGVFYLGRDADPATGDVSEAPVLYDAADLTTHAFIVGMTGSGKTGLGVGLIEEAALDGIPVIAIDPKGDLGNLALQFPDLAPADFRPWIDPAEATRDGTTPDALADQKAELWKKGLAKSGQGPERIARLRDAADVRIYTPGSDAGLPVSVLGSLAPPPDAPGSEAFRDRVEGTVGGLLTLMQVDADAASGENVFLSKVVTDAWAAGRTLVVEDLIHALLDPPFETLGVMSVDDFFPERQRKALAMTLNGLVASPAFAAWTKGAPLDAGKLFYGASGKPQVSVMSIAHLDDAERLFFVTKLLSEVLAWMRRQPGTGSLRAILYMDEIYGYLPPSANPPTKTLLLTLMKQARAFGLGVVLATQNPVDLDYKALANCGTWLVGRLQTERDKARLLDGLEGAAGGIDRADMDRLLSSIGKRRFLLHNVHESEPRVLATRWAMSYLAGPLTRRQIGTLMAEHKDTLPPEKTIGSSATPPAAALDPAAASGERPALDVPQVVLAGAADVYHPMLLARAEVPVSRSRPPVEHTQHITLLAEVADAPDWHTADALDARPETGQPVDGATFADVPAALADPASYPRWESALKKWLQTERPLRLFRSPETKLTSAPGEDERAFRIRLAQVAREARDAQKDDLRERYQKKLDALEKRMDSAEAAVDREAAQASQRKMDTVVRVGTTLLGAFLGRGRTSMSSIGVTARSASRASKESADVRRAQQKLDGYRDDYAELEADLQREMDDIDLRAAPDAAALETVEIKARQTDMHVTELALAWVPYRREPGGRLVRA
ncbi:helicase HerA domain-containing protein [Rubrivirga sp. IMCC43871]|uniref:helicase HerA domain-containing protein n=1 Tax=Rubrivirga sp. IMCC43871 TaxID=3391575 RepID=UPI00398FCA7D